MSILAIDLSEKELEYLKLAIEKMFKDAQYYSKYDQEKYAKILMEKLAKTIRNEKELDDLLENFSHLEPTQYDVNIDFDLFDDEEYIL